MEPFKAQLCEIVAMDSGLDTEAILRTRGLMSAGILDSFALVGVISLVEARLGHEVPPEDLTFENFDSVDAICAYAGRLNAG